MRMRKSIGIAVLAILTISTIGTQAEGFDRSGWYFSAGLGNSGGDDFQQVGFNRDTFCYPDAACFASGPNNSVAGYQWSYDIALDQGPSFELSIGKYLGRARVELALSQQTNDTEQIFSGITYLDGSPVLPLAGGNVDSNVKPSIDHRQLQSLSVDVFVDLPDIAQVFTPYVGIGLGRGTVTIADVRFSSEFRNEVDTDKMYSPALSFYNSRQDEDLTSTTSILRLHLGADYALSYRTAVGLKFTYLITEDVNTVGHYETHPMFELEPNFGHENEFAGEPSWQLMLNLKRGF